MEASPQAARLGAPKGLAVAGLVATVAVLPFLLALGPAFLASSGRLPALGVHAAASLLVLALGVRLGLPVAAAAGGAVLFALHPIHVEVVLDRGGHGTLLAAALVIATVLAHDLAVRREAWAFSALPLVALAVAFALDPSGALGAVAALGWSLLVDRRAWSARGTRAFALTTAYVAVLLAHLVSAVRAGSAGPHALLARAVALGHGLAALVLPLTVPADGSLDAAPLTGTLEGARAALSVTLLSAVLTAAFLLRRRRPALTFLALWYGAALLPAAGTLAERADAERWLYLPSVAFCLAAAWLVHLGAERFEPAETRPRLGWLVPSIAVLLVLVLGWRTARDARAWREGAAAVVGLAGATSTP